MENNIQDSENVSGWWDSGQFSQETIDSFPRHMRKHFKRLIEAVTICLADMNQILQDPDMEQRERKLRLAINVLTMEKEAAKQFGLKK